MWTYIIIAIITVIALKCIYRNKANTAKKYFSMIGIFILITSITTITVNYIRKDKLKIVTTIRAVTPLSKIIYRTDSTYITVDSFNLHGTTAFVKYKPCTKRIPGVVYDFIDVDCKYTYVDFKNNFTLYALDGDKDTIKLYDDTHLRFNDTTSLVKYKSEYIGDKWTSVIAFQSFNTVHVLNIDSMSYNYLKLKNPKDLKKWQID